MNNLQSSVIELLIKCLGILDTTRYFKSATELSESATRAGIHVVHRIVAWMTVATADPQRRRGALQLLWIASIVCLLFVTAALIGALYLVTSSLKPGIMTATILWSICLGGTALIALPPKAVATTFGGIIGASLSEITSGAGLISKVNAGVQSIATELGTIVGAAPQDVFVAQCVWVSVIITALVCLPAFFFDK